MESHDDGATEPRTRAHRVARRWPVVAVTLVMVLSVSAPMAIGGVGAAPVESVADAPPANVGDGPAQQTDGPPTDGPPTDEQWTTPPAQVGQTEANETVDGEKREAAEEGVDEAVAALQRQGVSVNQTQRAAAVNGTVDAVAQHQNASVEQVQNASYGAVTGAFLQSQNVSVEQVQNATAGGAGGALSQYQNASATQLQHAAFGATHGAVAQRQNATIEQVQVVAQGAAAGAAHEAGKRDENESREKAHPGAIREAAQGAAFGALTQTQNVSVEQRQSAAVGAAEGALSQNQSVAVEQRQTASVKQIQVAAMGAAEGALSVTQQQAVTVEQVQAAARGACKGTLEQSQSVSVSQIQSAAYGAAKGAISQSQTASVTQIQHAATGAAKGVLVQSQSVSITQIQYAATGAAKGAASSAAQSQVVNVEQIQAAAAGAGQGTVIQIQEINIVQIQIISESAAGGALSQHQTANVVQIQSAARGASEGSLALTQRQEVTVEQTQIVTRRAASDTAGTAAQLNVDVDVTIYNYAKGSAQDPDDGQDGADDGDEQLRSLFASAEGETIFLANPNDVAVTVTITSDDGDVETVTLAPGESTNLQRDRGTYTLTAETADGQDVELAGRAELTVSVGDALQSLTASVENGSLSVANPNDERVTVEVTGDEETSFQVPADWDLTRAFGPGNYTATAETTDGTAVQINDQDAFEFSIESADPPDTPPEPPEPVDVNVTVSSGNISFDNPSQTTVTVTATDENDSEQTVDVPGGENVTEAFDPGTYELTGSAADNRTVTLDGQAELTVNVSEAPLPEPDEPIDLNVSVSGQNVSVENPSGTNVTVTATNESDGERTLNVSAGANVTEQFEPGNYTLTGESDDEREVLLENESALDVQVAEPDEDVDSLNVTVEGENVTVDNPNDVAVTVTANATDANASEAANRTVDVGPETNVTAAFEPGNYTLTAVADDGTTVPVNGETEHEITVEGAEPPEDGERTIDSCTVVDEAGQYELAGDVEGDIDGVCLRIEASDVVIDGNDSTLVGDGGENNTGIQTYDPDGNDVENVTVRNLEVRNWNNGVEIGNFSDDVPAQARLENVTITENDGNGAFLVSASGTEFENVSSTRNGAGIRLWETENVTFERIDASANDGYGLHLWDLVQDSEFSQVNASGNGLEGVFVGVGASGNTLSGFVVADNGETGIHFSDSAENVVRDSLVADNDGAGISSNFISTQTLDNVTVRNHTDAELNPRDTGFEPGPFTATDLRLAPVGSLAFDEEAVTLDVVDRDELPSLPENATAIQDGLNVTELENSTDATLAYQGADPDAEVELWRHDGSEWTQVETFDAGDANGSVETTLTADGVYVLAQSEEAPASFSVSDLAPAEANVSQGEAINVSATVENVGGESATQAVELRIDGTTVADQELELDAGNSSNVTFEDVDTSGLAPGEYEHGVFTPADNATGTLTVEAEAEPGVEFLNCTTAQVDGSYDRLSVTLGYYAEDGNATSEYVWTPVDVPTDRPVDGQTVVTVGEQNETTVTGDGTLVIQLSDPGAFGDENRSFVANVNTSASPTGQEDLSVAQPNAQQCREDVRPELPTLASEEVEVVDNETALVNFSYENPNDAPMEPAESQFTSGAVAGEPPAVLDAGPNFVVVEWTPVSTAESVTWTLNLSNFDLLNVSSAGPTAADVPGLLEPPAETETPTETETATETDSPTPTETATPEATETPTPEDTPTPTPEETETSTEEPTTPSTTPTTATGDES
ncbi:right-handed parallel beta-helix repeat-containing protein [Halobacteria archaeon HArc-gm2]|nr:right-handed parallel beta-helix repeat-containing protein [Halobacteria archaeon HArc-gm2]